MRAGRRARRAVAVIGALVAAAAVAAVAAAAPAAAAPASEACSGGGACAAPEAEVRIIAPAEGAALAALAGAAAAGGGGAARTGAVVVEARGVFAKVALYLDGQFVSATPLGASGRAELEFPLPGGAEACGGWHFVEVALMDAEDWRLENPEAEAAVRFTLGCAGRGGPAAAREQREQRERAEVFEGIYESFGWEPSADGSKETRSGPGSYVARTNASRAFLSDVLRRFSVKTMLDAGCGDVNWQGLTPGIDEVDYVGIDIVPQMIADNARRLGGRRMRFAVKDVVKDDLGGPYDLVLCRDTLFHLPLWDAVQVSVRHAALLYGARSAAPPVPLATHLHVPSEREVRALMRAASCCSPVLLFCAARAVGWRGAGAPKPAGNWSAVLAVALRRRFEHQLAGHRCRRLAHDQPLGGPFQAPSSCVVCA